MAEGKIDALKFNWGFIEQADESKVYFSQKSLEGITFKELKKGDRVSYEVGFKEDGKTFATSIRKIVGNGAPSTATSLAAERLSRSPAAQVKKLLVACLEKEISDIKVGLEFEKLTFLLLRLLGIHTLYQYDEKQQAGRADGFFICDRLAVMYDCTLRSGFEEIKQDQVENYVNKMRQSSITIDVKTGEKTSLSKTHDIQNKARQVWIITKKETRDLSETEGVAVREVSAIDLVSLLEVKLNANNFKEADLVKYLLDLGELAVN